MRIHFINYGRLPENEFLERIIRAGRILGSVLCDGDRDEWRLLLMFNKPYTCFFCGSKMAHYAYYHNEFGFSVLPAAFSPDMEEWDFAYKGKKAFDKAKPYCRDCYMKANQDDPQVKGWEIAEVMTMKSYKETYGHHIDVEVNEK